MSWLSRTKLSLSTPLATVRISPTMNRIFGRGTQAPKPSLDDAISSIDERVGSLDVKLTKINSELQTYQQKMSRMRDGPGKLALKQKALKLLRQRKQIEGQRDQLESQQWNMTQAQMTTENLKNTMVTIDAMKTTNKQLKQQYGKIDIDKIEDLQDEMLDLIEKSNDLLEALLTNIGDVDDISESELDAELDALGEEMEFERELGETTGGLPLYLEDAELPNFVDEPQAPAKEQEAA